MANLGNVWHIPTNPQPRGRGGMRSPGGPVVAATSPLIISGHQFQGEGNPGNQLQDGSAVHYRRRGDQQWMEAPLLWFATEGNDKFYAARLAVDPWAVGVVVEYYLVAAFDDHDLTFVHGDDVTSFVTAVEADAQQGAYAFALADPARLGRWEPVRDLGVVGVHAHLLPTGSVLLWGRRDAPDLTLDEPGCTPRLWDPVSGQVVPTAAPTSLDGGPVNLFCSGHAFLPDGRLLVVGGHVRDGFGLDQATVYDPVAGTWEPQPRMNDGRWYPAATTLPDGGVLVTSGTHDGNIPNNQPQVWRGGVWHDLAVFPGALPNYPTMHVDDGGQVFMSGSLGHSWRLDVAGAGSWEEVETQRQVGRDYAPAVLVDDRHVLYLGGGQDGPGGSASDLALVIDIDQPAAGWQPGPVLPVRRRQHNATLLADGTVLVTGGTRGVGFNDLGRGQPVHEALLRRPDGSWAPAAAEEVDRCYHSTAVLLPDGRVLSAGGGEYKPDNVNPNEPQDTHADAQVYSPPYLFAGDRPEITDAPDALVPGVAFTVQTPQAADITRVTLLRLTSVTHTDNMSQRINVLTVANQPQGLVVTPPATSEQCPPGPYLMFLINAAGVPSVARIVRVAPRPTAPQLFRAALPLAAAESRAKPRPVPGQGGGRLVTVGVTGLCPYGIGPCWGRANEALWQLPDVGAVAGVPDVVTSTALIELSGRGLPPLRDWQARFDELVAASYALRGVEITLTGTLGTDPDGTARLDVPASAEPVRLEALTREDVVQWDPANQRAAAVSDEELHAFAGLAAAAAGSSLTVTGPLRQAGDGYVLEVRELELLP